MCKRSVAATIIHTVNILTQRVGNGAWSFEGLQRTDTDGNNTMIQCSSTHLTSFSILAKVGGPMTYPVSCSNFLNAYSMYVCLCYTEMLYFAQ